MKWKTLMLSLPNRLASGHVGSPGQLQHHGEGTEVAFQHVARGRRSLGKRQQWPHVTYEIVALWSSTYPWNCCTVNVICVRDDLLILLLLFFSSVQPKYGVKMLSVLNQMPQRHGPDAFFNFPGRSAAVSFHIAVAISNTTAIVKEGIHSVSTDVQYQ